MHCLEVKNRDIEMKNKETPLVHQLMYALYIRVAVQGVLTQLFAQ